MPAQDHDQYDLVRRPELRSIVEKTIPFEAAHAEWFREQGPRMLRPVDRKARWR